MISTYSELQSAVARWMHRSDLTDQIPDFIALAESRLNRRLMLRMMETTASLTLLNGQTIVALPQGFVSPLALWEVTGTGKRLLNMFAPGVQSDTPGVQTAWRIEGGDIVFPRPAAGDTPLSLLFVKGFKLSDGEPTNWLLENHPDAYLFGALVEASPYCQDSESLAIWAARYEAAVGEINAKEAKSKGLATLATDLPGMSRR